LSRLLSDERIPVSILDFVELTSVSTRLKIVSREIAGSEIPSVSLPARQINACEMTILGRCRLLMAGLVLTGCGPNKPADVAEPGRVTQGPASADGRSTEVDAGLWGDRISDGQPVDPFANLQSRAVVLIFLSTDCPIANRYAPVLRRLFESYQAKEVAFWLVYGDATETPEKIRRHLEEYQHLIPALRDPEHRLVNFCEVQRTPEAVVFSPGRQRQYRGRIDNRFTDYGKSRETASQHDLRDAIDAVLAGREVATPVTAAIGCPIPGVGE
jgi:hypothetical protein